MLYSVWASAFQLDRKRSSPALSLPRARTAELLDETEHENMRLDTRVTELEDKNAKLRKQIEGSTGKNAGGGRKKP